MMLKDASLGLNLTIIGGITSLLPVAYAFSKGISGFLGSTMSPRMLMSFGLGSTGLACLAFGMGSHAAWFAAFWAINGLLQVCSPRLNRPSSSAVYVQTHHRPSCWHADQCMSALLTALWLQGLGAPACAKLLTQWYSSSERGTAWSIWTASNNVGGFAAPWIAGTAAGVLGWRWGMWVPGFFALAVASLIIFTITDKPRDRGFRPVELAKSSGSETETATVDEVQGPSVKEILMQDVLPNPWVWLFALSYFFVYLVRQGTSSWFVHYLMNVKGITDLPAAAAQVSGLEVGGFCGAISAGAATSSAMCTSSALLLLSCCMSLDITPENVPAVGCDD
jgi:MFS transporter, OPA family, sugar phosphate sensor protein UhpC